MSFQAGLARVGRQPNLARLGCRARRARLVRQVSPTR